MKQMYCLTWNVVNIDVDLLIQKKASMQQKLQLRRCRRYHSRPIHTIWQVTWLLVKLCVNVKLLKLLRSFTPCMKELGVTSVTSFGY